MVRRQCVVLLAVMALLLSVGGVAQGQVITATIRGRVVDEQGGVLPGATVTATQTSTNTAKSVVTAALGQYFLPNLPAGPYELSVSLAGFAPLQRKVELTVGMNVTLEFTMKVGTVEAAVTVTAEATLLETTKTVVGATISKSMVDSLPTVNRDFSGLAQLAPGVSSGVGGNGATLAVNAQRGYQNNVFVDGASNQWQYYGRQASTFSQDWIQEFQVLTNSFSAEFGNASGGILNVITRSGANQFQGRAYFYHRQKALDSPPFAGYFENDDINSPVYLTKDEVPDYTQRRWGGFFGGPIVKNRLFFFAGYEDLLRESNDALAISDYWKARGYHSVEPIETTDHPFLFKGDVNLTGDHRLSVRVDRTINKAVNESQYGAVAPYEGRDTFGGPVWNVVANLTSTLGNSAFNEFRGYFMSNKPPIICNLSGQGGMANFDQGPPGTFANQRFPTLRIGCPIFHGLEGEENFGLMDSFSFIRGRHQVKLGGQMIQNRMIVNIANFHDGYWRFGQDQAFDKNNPATYPFRFTGNVGPGAWKSPIWNYNLYLQDTWQARDNLTLNLGVRYDVDRSVTAGNEFVDQKNAAITAAQGGGPALRKTNIDYNNVSPRLGFVWTPTADRRTTVRGAFGFFYDQNHGNFNAIYIVNTLLGDLKTINCNLPSQNPFWSQANSVTVCRAFLAQNYPFFPDLAKAPASTQSLDTLDVNLQTPRTAQLTFGMAHEFPGGLTVAADFVHSRGNGIIYIEKNLKLVSPTEVQVIDPRFANVNELQNTGWVHYTALQAQAQFRRQALNLGLSYTLSKADSNLPSGSIYGSYPTNPFDLSIDEGPDATDQRHNLVINGSYTFPWDIQLAGIGVFRSARPWTPYTTENPQGLVYPPYPEGKSARRGDGYKSLDLRIGKAVKFGGKVQATLFWEMFNAFNWASFFSYDGEMESSSFGLPLEASDMRRQQLGIRIDF